MSNKRALRAKVYKRSLCRPYGPVFSAPWTTRCRHCHETRNKHARGKCLYTPGTHFQSMSIAEYQADELRRYPWLQVRGVRGVPREMVIIDEAWP